jgi:alpha-L-rhamnosidase
MGSPEVVAQGHLVPVDLRCAHQEEPLSVEMERVRFRWRTTGPGPGGRQTAYQVLVGRPDEEPSGRPELVWDSGRVESEDASDIAYSGAPLANARRHWWKVRVWDEAGRPSPYSAAAGFETALGPDAWEAVLIGLGPDNEPYEPPSGEGPVDPVILAMKPAPYLRRAFILDQEVRLARLHATALGTYQISLNGRRVGNSVLAPGWTDYSERMLYQTYDVTGLLNRDENVVAAIVADGWACSFYGEDPKRPGGHYARDPQLLLQLEVTFDDGSRWRLVTNQEWRSSTGAVVYADLLMGERREHEREPRGWDRPGYDASGWRGVSCHERGPALLVADPGPPVRVTGYLPAQSIARGPSGELVVDFGQNLAGWCRLIVDQPEGTDIRVRHGEVLGADGSLYVDNLGTARQADSYTTAGGQEVFEPRFTVHGFRYAEIMGLSGGLGPGAVTACTVGSDTPRTGSFECSAAGVNRLYTNIDWSQRDNFLSIPTDCPQRNERLGWLGDAQIFVRTAAYNRDVASFFSKWLDDVVDAQLPSGAFPDFAPLLGHKRPGAPAWGDAGVIVPWTIYKMYGDRAILERCFRAMTAWMDFLEAANPDRLRARGLGNNYGDWLAPKGDLTPRVLLATAYWAYDATLMAEVAGVLGHPEQAARYEALGQRVREAFARHYVDDAGRLMGDTQTGYVLALHMDLVGEDLRPALAAHLVEAIARQDWHLSTGFVGVGYLLPVLSSTGHNDVAYRLLEQRSFPSWLYTVDRGATTIWERWDGWTEERGFQSPRMNSFNHYSLGSVGEWLYRFVLGIELAPRAAGFDRLVLRPHPGGSLTFARGSFRSVRGEIATSWALESSRFTFSVRLPPNVQASVRIPSGEPSSVVDGTGRGPARVEDYPGETGQREAVFEVGPGEYSFSGAALGGCATPRPVSPTMI